MKLTQVTKVELTEEEWSVFSHALYGMYAAHSYGLKGGYDVAMYGAFTKALRVALQHIFGEYHTQLEARYDYSPMSKSEFETWAADVIHEHYPRQRSERLTPDVTF